MPRAPATDAARQQGLRLQQLREALDLTQPALAEVMGCAPNTVSGYESGRTRIDILALQRFCEHTRISSDWIVNGTLGSLPMNIAARIQAAQRAGLSHVKAKRGRPRKPSPSHHAPTVDEAPGWPPEPPTRTVHEPTSRYLPPPKHTPRDNSD